MFTYDSPSGYADLLVFEYVTAHIKTRDAQKQIQDLSCRMQPQPVASHVKAFWYGAICRIGG